MREAGCEWLADREEDGDDDEDVEEEDEDDDGDDDEGKEGEDIDDEKGDDGKVYGRWVKSVVSHLIVVATVTGSRGH